MAESTVIKVDISEADVAWWVVWSDGADVVSVQVPGVFGPVVDLGAVLAVRASMRLEAGEKLDRLSGQRLAEGRLSDALSDGLWHRIDEVLDAMGGPWRVREADRKLVHRLADRGVVRRRLTGAVAWFAVALPVELEPSDESTVEVPPVSGVRRRSLPRADDAREWSVFKSKKKAKPVKDWDALAQAAGWAFLNEGWARRPKEVGEVMKLARRPGRSVEVQAQERERDLAWMNQLIEDDKIFLDEHKLLRVIKPTYGKGKDVPAAEVPDLAAF